MERQKSVAYLEARWTLLSCLVLCVITSATSCKQISILSGKRVLEARANFGKVMKDCSKELAKMASLTPKKDFVKRVSLVCAAYNSCIGEANQKIKEGFHQKPHQMVLECGMKITQNKSSQFYTVLGDTDRLMNAVHEALACLNQTGAIDLPLETLDDMVAFARRFSMTFG
ncbi:uncharacterized protein LOC142584424 isoform X1 [Dermacentor variabilis]|uniref:uncharacterized protein LOC142584424 isoform X1 n=1 Tax=Dermacentor variabilis TaxID=34621 RepID=UPI003F5CAA81